MTKWKHIEKRGGEGEAGEADKHDRNHRMPDEYDVTSEGRADIL